MRSLKENISGVVDLGVVIMLGIAFAGIMVVAYIIFKLKDQLIPAYPAKPLVADAAINAQWNTTYGNINSQMGNITGGFDNAVALILVAVTIFILAIAISALLMLRGK